MTTTIPSFPTFRRLERGDRPRIEALNGRFPPISDFGFVSLWAWDTKESCLISMLGNNLIFRLKNYTSDEHFLTVLGQDAVAEAAETLLSWARREGLVPELRLVPEAVIEADARLAARFAVTADPDNFDYVYRVHDWAHFSTSGFREHRRLVAKCREHADLDFRSFDPKAPLGQKAIFDLFNRWVEQKPASVRGDTEQERTALHRLIELTGDNTLAASGFFDGERLVGFSLWEGLPGSDFATIHFQKTDRDYRGLSSWQPHAMGQLLLESGYRHINGEQDLGIRGLRMHKRSFQPCQFLRKYVIAERGS
jgi:hypothetical protein